MLTIQTLIDLTLFRLTNLNPLEILDLLLVLAAVYLLLRLMQRSRAALLLRGVLVLTVVLFVITLILPLPAFDWLVRVALIAMLVTTPIIFQPELRRLLERIGRNTGVAWQVRQTTVEQLLPRLVRAVENMADKKIGALIVLEGHTALQDVVETGVPIGAEVTSEVLQALFYPGNPLHDGAAILRADKVIAAGCVLPLTQRPLFFKRRLGTRHRAAVGLGEHSDALVVVVSEETGEISVAQRGKLHRPLDGASLRRYLYDFFAPTLTASPRFSIRRLIRRGLRKLKPHRLTFPTARQLVSEAGVVFIALLLALATWTFVIQETNPAQQVRLENIPLIIKDMPANSTLMAAPPANVSAIIQTTASVRPTLGSRSLEAAVSLKDVSPGLHSLPITVRSNVPLVQVISVDPPVLDLEMAAIISRTVEVAVEMVEQQNLSRAYQVVGAPQAQPAAVEIMGPEPLVQRVSKAQAGLSLANASSSLREVRPLVALDESGAEVSGVTFRPAMVQVSLTIRRRINARDVGVRVVTQGAPPSGYWLSNISVTPGSVTLQGNPDILDQVGGYIDTLPVDVSSSTGNVSLQMPLELPPDLQVVDSNGQPANTVTVQLGISARQGNLSITRPVKLIGSNSDLAVSVTPATVSLILSGPLPTLSQIASDPSLVQVLVAVAGLEPGLNSAVTPTIIAPDEVKAQAVPPTVAVILPQNGNSSPPEVSKR